tara:strand:- start:820 stop:954 length:135 start_codon:yes stop_codon:yes gene_type:complete
VRSQVQALLGVLALIAQLGERKTEDLEVAGSSPAQGIMHQGIMH